MDGLRGLAALYVLLDHCWLLTYPGFPTNNGPWWVGWLLYGHLSVVFFLVVSGFSLAVAPARAGWQLGGLARYARRRAWRILPPYWAALVFSLVVAWTVVPQPHSGPPNLRTVAVYGLLLQGVEVARTPNGTFWSIAVEAELYLVFPLLILLRHKLGGLAVLLLATLPVLAFGVLDPHWSAMPTTKLGGLAPQLSPVFAFGVVAAGVVAASERVRALPWGRIALLAGLPVVTVAAIAGSVWNVRHLFWLDLAFAAPMALLLVVVATGRAPLLTRVLETRPVKRLGAFSYSLYLVHLPIVVVVSRTLTGHRLVPHGLPLFWTTSAIAVPVALGFARLFAGLFEIPFQRHRGWPRARVVPEPRRPVEA